MARELTAFSHRRVLVYGRGNGRGHATRTASLCRALDALGAATQLYVDESALGVALALGMPREDTRVAHAVDPSSSWQSALHEFAPTDVIVDTFPEGLDGEVEPNRYASARWITLLRCRRDASHECFLRALSRYAAAYDLEPELKWAPPSVIAFGATIRELTGSTQGDPLTSQILLVTTELRQRSFLERLEVRLRAQGCMVRCHPVSEQSRFEAPLLTECDLRTGVVVGPAGYNLTYELASLGVWHLALPAQRQFDCQALRAQQIAVCVDSPDAVERRVVAWLRHGGRRPKLRCRTMKELAEEILEPSPLK